MRHDTRYILAYAYVLSSGVGLPYLIQADDLVGQQDFLSCCEITTWGLLRDFSIMSSLVFVAFMLFEGARLLWPRLRANRRISRILSAAGLALASFTSASWALTAHYYMHGTTWAPGEPFIAFVLPEWPAMLAVIVVGAFLGAHLENERFKPRSGR